VGGLGSLDEMLGSHYHEGKCRRLLVGPAYLKSAVLRGGGVVQPGSGRKG